ncbi:MAG: hypothetical protein AB1847_08990 [bacterium]
MSLTIGWFTTAEDTKAHDLFTATYSTIQNLGLDVHFAYIFCNRRKGEDPKSDQFFSSVQDFGINLITHSSREFQGSQHAQTGETGNLSDWQEEYHNQVIEKISSYPIDIALLVGYTPAVTVEFIKRHTTVRFRSALPDGPSGNWPTVIWQLIGTRSAVSGATLYLLTEEDTEWGVPIAYCHYPIRKREFSSYWHDLDRKMKNQSLAQLIATEGEDLPLFKAIKEAGEDLESPLLILTIKDILRGILKLEDQKVIRDDQPQSSGGCLTHEIEDFLIEQEDDDEEDEQDQQDEEETGDGSKEEGEEEGELAEEELETI